MHLKRWITALCALPFLLVLVRYGGTWAFALFIVIIALLGLREYYAMVLTGGQKILEGAGLASGCLLLVGSCLYGLEAVSGITAVCFIGICTLCLFSLKKGDAASDILARTVCGVIYIPFLLSHLILLRNQADGSVWIFFVLFVVFALDTCAYYAGTYAGRHKLYPRISPNKTWEGAVGGLAGALSVGLFFKVFFLTDVAWTHLILLTFYVAISGQIGDLVESMIKRSVNVKDSGCLLPGHGGILDRIDSLLFASPIVYYYKIWIIR